jgi:basic membrane lipoprotein Med (substrate-binding protein (PBP1-ABC) superfamily)
MARLKKKLKKEPRKELILKYVQNMSYEADNSDYRITWYYSDGIYDYSWCTDIDPATVDASSACSRGRWRFGKNGDLQIKTTEDDENARVTDTYSPANYNGASQEIETLKQAILEHSLLLEDR